ncbi:MAG TPA: carbohydrate ABC transporter permease [Candidatus Hydrogenedentes bacterium]|mgnify:FL=1|jgi:ABC-type glycerol-3-phosphate transport system permease component|nr:carbohydrate ABC transporter permease [Candidatus Hydrogenedentota bacterium]MDY0033856.1 carbohydrate ABC transporter permease [FCB group bacterium]HNV20211.1 carbohydrate ABC transporter permease [Candidatus Hydrogenedentota bacterium]HNZ19175.1 carbohydrate ABC transporter permease [Candidatus Hydrogenedentota bacterium]HOH32377.1 carbohydrate ABC transporter permease [Candidatus Hydrogenedentota bacterium]
MTRKAAIYALLTAGALLMTFPFVWMVSTALKSEAEALLGGLDLFPARPMWSNFVVMFQEAPQFATYFYNSFVVAFAVTASVLVTSMFAGYTFARLDFPGRGLLFSLVLATMMVPFEVTLIPNFMLINALHWKDTYAALIVPWCANAFSIFLMRQAFLGLPADFFDAAKVDGCGHLRFLVWIATPLVKPVAVTVGLFAFLGSYNSLMWPLVVTDRDEMRVVQVGLTLFSSDEGVRLHLLMCAATVVILPTLGLYFAAQRYFLESAISAGIKG